MTPSYYAQHSHNLPPQCFIYRSTCYKEKWMIPFLYRGFLLYPPFILSSLHTPPYLSLLSPPPCHHLASFPLLDNNKLSYFLKHFTQKKQTSIRINICFFCSMHFFMILALLSFCHFPFNKETPRNNILSTYKPT
jgi:hypothetical protein